MRTRTNRCAIAFGRPAFAAHTLFWALMAARSPHSPHVKWALSIADHWSATDILNCKISNYCIFKSYYLNYVFYGNSNVTGAALQLLSQVRPRRDGSPGELDEASHTIDYMWLSTASRVGVERVLLLPAYEELGPTRLPSSRAPSDHLPLAADLRVKLWSDWLYIMETLNLIAYSVYFSLPGLLSLFWELFTTRISKCLFFACFYSFKKILLIKILVKAIVILVGSNSV